MKHEIEIPDLPDGWEAVAYRYVKNGDDVLLGKQIVSWLHKDLSTGSRYLIVRKKQPRRIVLEEIGECTDNSHNHTIYVKGITIDIYSNKLWKIVEDNQKN